MVSSASGAGRDVPIGDQLEALRQADLRVATIGYRLATAAVPLCARRTRVPGWVVADASQYAKPARPTAVSMFHLESGPAVTAVVSGAAADLAGVRQGDALVAVNGRRVTPALAPRGGDASGEIYAALVDELGVAFAAGPVQLDVARDGRRSAIRLTGALACDSLFQLTLEKKINAGADGRIVSIALGMEELAANDDELAFAMAHELSHNILGHRALIEAHRVSVDRTEMEADYYGVHIMAMAGYDPFAAARLVQRAAKTRSLFWIAQGHMSDGERSRFLDRVAQSVSATKARGLPLRPNVADLPRAD